MSHAIKGIDAKDAQNNAKKEVNAADIMKKTNAAVPRSLVEIGFFKNIWNFEPVYVRWLLQGLSTLFTSLAIAAFKYRYTKLGSHKWTFFSFDLVLLGLLCFWFFSIEHGGAHFLFAPDWRDAYYKTRSTTTNCIVTVYVGSDVAEVSIPLNSFEFEKDGSVDELWLADELELQLPMHKFRS